MDLFASYRSRHAVAAIRLDRDPLLNMIHENYPADLRMDAPLEHLADTAASLSDMCQLGRSTMADYTRALICAQMPLRGQPPRKRQHRRKESNGALVMELEATLSSREAKLGAVEAFERLSVVRAHMFADDAILPKGVAPGSAAFLKKMGGLAP